MKNEQVGLRFRVSRAARQIQAQHDRLHPIFLGLKRALVNRSTREAQTEVFRLEGALQAHFLLEEQIVFPALHGLYPECQAELAVLEADHVRIRHAIRQVIDQTVDSDLGLAAETLESAARLFADHELREQALLAGLAQDTTL